MRLGSGWLVSTSNDSLSPRLRLGLPFTGPSSTCAAAAAPLRREDALASGSASSEIPAGVLGISCLILRWVTEPESVNESSSRDATERPRLLVEVVLPSRLVRTEDVDFSVLVSKPGMSSTYVGGMLLFLPGLGFSPSASLNFLRASPARGDTSRVSNIGDGALSLIGLTSSGRGRTGEPGDLLIRGDLFHGVREPLVSIDGRGRLPSDAENDGVCLAKPGVTLPWTLG